MHVTAKQNRLLYSSLLSLFLLGVVCLMAIGDTGYGIRSDRVGAGRMDLVSKLLNADEMEELVAGQGCFGFNATGCCDLVLKYYSVLWTFRISGPTEALAAYIDGRQSGRCF